MSPTTRRHRTSRLIATPSGQPGDDPGSLKAPPDAHRPVARFMAYDAATFREGAVTSDVVETLPEEGKVLWIDVEGLGDSVLIEVLGRRFGVHALALEDIMTPRQRPKFEAYDGFLFIVLKMAVPGSHPVELEQVSLCLGRGFVVTFQEGHGGDCFESVRARVRAPTSRLRQRGPDYLAYALIDAVVDFYFPLLERMGEELELLEDEVLTSPRPGQMLRIHELRQELLELRRAIWPLRELLTQISRSEEDDLIQDDTRIYLRDCHDHTLRLFEALETCREMSTGLMEAYHISMSAQTGEVMRVLTIIATVFIPLTFISGVYGMNFDTNRSKWNMPELEWTYGYPFALGLMLATVCGLTVYFWRKGWLVRGRTRPPTLDARRERARTAS